MKKAACKKVEFQLAATPGSKVSVAGTFNNWDPEKNPMKDNPENGLYKTVIAIPPGRHEYGSSWMANGRTTRPVPTASRMRSAAATASSK